MTNYELLIYFVEVIIIFFLSLSFHKLVKPRHSVWVSLLLLLSSWMYMMVFFYSISLSIDKDVYRYINDAKIIKAALYNNPFHNIILMISPGGNYFIPESAFPFVLETSSWSNPTFYFLVKIYTLFGFLSSFNLYNISLWFVFTSFISKMLILRLADKFDFDDMQYMFLLGFILLGGSDILYVSCMLKDNVTFLLIVSIINTYYSNLKYKNYLLVFLYVTILYIRPENIVFLTLGFLIKKMIDLYLSKQKVKSYIILLSILFSCIVFYITPYYEKVFKKINDFLNLPDSNTSLVKIDSLSPFEGIDHKIERIMGVIYTPMSNRGTLMLYYLEDVYNVLLVMFVFYLVVKIDWKRINNVFHLILYSSLGLTFVAIVVPNFGSQIRYRAIYLIFLIFSLIYMSILNNVKKNIFN